MQAMGTTTPQKPHQHLPTDSVPHSPPGPVNKIILDGQIVFQSSVILTTQTEMVVPPMNYTRTIEAE